VKTNKTKHTPQTTKNMIYMNPNTHKKRKHRQLPYVLAKSKMFLFS